MSEHDMQTFIDALGQLEVEQNVEPLVELYAEDSRCENLTRESNLTGPDGARQFWTEDRGLFDTVHSKFHNTVSSGDVAMLEWTRTGVGRGGDSIDLSGVSVIEFQDGKIVRFAGYFDPSSLGAQAL
jgi:ketosteroid isomerase-like protein